MQQKFLICYYTPIHPPKKKNFISFSGAFIMVCKKLKWRFFILLANSHNHDIIKHSNNAIEKDQQKLVLILPHAHLYSYFYFDDFTPFTINFPSARVFISSHTEIICFFLKFCYYPESRISGC